MDSLWPRPLLACLATDCNFVLAAKIVPTTPAYCPVHGTLLAFSMVTLATPEEVRGG